MCLRCNDGLIRLVIHFRYNHCLTERIYQIEIVGLFELHEYLEGNIKKRINAHGKGD